MSFFNREQELGFLDSKYLETDAQRIVIYGKRRVGKTELIKQFFREKPHVYFLADKLPDGIQLGDIARKLGEHFLPCLAKAALPRQ